MTYFSPSGIRGKPIFFQCNMCYNLGSREAKKYNRDTKNDHNPMTYCSRECRNSFFSKNKIPDRCCEECKNLFPVKGDRRKKYCSRSCSGHASNRNRDPADRRKQAVSLKNSMKGSEARAKQRIMRELVYEKNPKYCIQCLGPNPWKHRNRKTCSYECEKKLHSSPEIAQKISISRRKRFADGSLKVTGGNTKWLDYNGTKVQGSYELRACHILDRWLKEGLITKWEYTNDRVKYITANGKQSTYLLDFKVWRNDLSIYYIETKGYERENDQLKWRSARDSGLELEVWFKTDINMFESQSKT